LVLHFVEVFARRMGKRIEQIPRATMKALIAYPWPGNVRELQNLIVRAVIRSDNGVLGNPLPASREAAVTLVVGDGTFQDSERVLILKALRAAGGMIGGPYGAATRLGLKRTSLISKMKRLGLYRPRRQNKINRLNEELSVSATMANSWSDTIEPDMTGT
jgi:transcriptional regulator with GAF, ATPase, and Fis domain